MPTIIIPHPFVDVSSRLSVGPRSVNIIGGVTTFFGPGNTDPFSFYPRKIRALDSGDIYFRLIFDKDTDPLVHANMSKNTELGGWFKEIHSTTSIAKMVVFW